MSTIKLLSTLSNPRHTTSFKEDYSGSEQTPTRDAEEGARYHQQTFGISSDPMTHFALAFASLIHDAGRFLSATMACCVLRRRLADAVVVIRASTQIILE